MVGEPSAGQAPKPEHSGEPPKPVECHLCGVRFTSRNDCFRHLRDASSSGGCAAHVVAAGGLPCAPSVADQRPSPAAISDALAAAASSSRRHAAGTDRTGALRSSDGAAADVPSSTDRAAAPPAADRRSGGEPPPKPEVRGAFIPHRAGHRIRTAVL